MGDHRRRQFRPLSAPDQGVRPLYDGVARAGLGCAVSLYGTKHVAATNKLKIADIKSTFNSNFERAEHIQTLLGQMRESEETEISRTNISKEIGKTVDEFLKPTYTAPDDELLKRKKRKFR